MPFTASTTPEDPTTLITAWFETPSGSFTAFQPNLAHTKFPSNDHPSDKASYTLRFDVPAGTTAVGNGLPTNRRSSGGRTITTFEERDPMASELVSLNAGALSVVNRGKIRRRHVPRRRCRPRWSTPSSRRTRSGRRTWSGWSDYVGRYPFATYGTLSADSNAGFALENQTLSLYPAVCSPSRFRPPSTSRSWSTSSPTSGSATASPRDRWRDVWLNEGHATWYEQLYGATVPRRTTTSRQRSASTTATATNGGRRPGRWPRRSARTNVLDLFNNNVYYGGATVLYALRQVVGDRTFYEIERRWAREYEGESASTDEFIALASRVAHRNLGPFLRDWLYGSKTPPMPGHPDWTVNAPDAAPAAPETRKAPTAADLERLAKR